MLQVLSQLGRQEENAVERLLAISKNDSRRSIPFVHIDEVRNRPAIVVYRRMSSARERNEYFSRWTTSQEEKADGSFACSSKSHRHGSDQKTRASKNDTTHLVNLARQTPTKSMRHIKDASSDDESIRFYHFENSKEYMIQYRETVTIPSILEYRKNLVSKPGKATVCSACSHEHSQSDLTSPCQCSKPSVKTQLKHSYATIGYVLYDQMKTSQTGQKQVSSLKRENKYCLLGYSNLGETRREPSYITQTTESHSGDLSHAAGHCRNISTPMVIHRLGSRQKACLGTKKVKGQQRKPAGASGRGISRTSLCQKTIPEPKKRSTRPQVDVGFRDRLAYTSLVNSLRPTAPKVAFPDKRKQFAACIMPMNANSGDV